MFNDLLKQKFESQRNVSFTENGARGYKTTNNALLDFNFKLPYYRSAIAGEIIKDFAKTIQQDARLALRYLFYLRDIRGGLGERRTFRILSRWLAIDSDVFRNTLPLFAEYGRWDDLIYLFNEGSSQVTAQIIQIIKSQLDKDIANYKENKTISLLAKWLPSVQGSQRKKALFLASALNLTEKNYRKTLSALRKYLDVVEVKMSDRKWETIDYEAVPSKANVKYNSAFLRHDESRRNNFLKAVSEGKAKINSSTNYPNDIINKYIDLDTRSYWGGYTVNEFDGGLEALWKALPDFNGGENVLVVADTSGSMTGNNAIPLKVCYGLTLYFSERAEGQFHNKAILFSSKPQYIDFDQAKDQSLYSRLKYLFKYNDYSNTNIEATFNLILNTAIENHLEQENLPKAVLVISDMEFDGATCDRRSNDVLFEILKDRFKAAGYQMPKLVFWNVASRSNTIPVKENSNGLVLVSGFSTNIVKMVLSGKFDPFEILKEQIMDSRYDAVEKAVFN